MQKAGFRDAGHDIRFMLHVHVYVNKNGVDKPSHLCSDCFTTWVLKLVLNEIGRKLPCSSNKLQKQHCHRGF